MSNHFWQERWEADDIPFHKSEINASLEKFYDRLELKASDQVFVPLCGKSLDMLFISKKGQRILGVELSEIAIKSFFTENKISYEVDDTLFHSASFEIYNTDLFKMPKEVFANVAGVYDRGSLIALPEDVRVQYAQQMTEYLPSGSKYLLITVEYPQSQMQGPPFSVSKQEVESLFKGFSTIEVLEEVSDELRSDENQLDYFTRRTHLLTR